MGKNFIKRTEEKIKSYFTKKNQIRILTSTVSDLENQILKINENIKNLNFLDIEKIDIKSPDFESILTKNSPSSYIENGIVTQIEQRERLLKNINQKLEDYKSKIYILNLETSQMKNIFNILREESKKLLILKYQKNKSEIEISNELNISISQYHRNKMKILKDIYNLMVMYKEI